MTGRFQYLAVLCPSQRTIALLEQLVQLCRTDQLGDFHLRITCVVITELVLIHVLIGLILRRLPRVVDLLLLLIEVSHLSIGTDLLLVLHLEPAPLVPMLEVRSLWRFPKLIR